MKERFDDWQPPEIPEGGLTKYNWMVQHKENLKLGHRTDIGAFCYINALHGVVIEDQVQLGSHCSVYSISTIDGKVGPVVLKRNCRIGSHSTIMPGVTVGENTMVGAGSFVNRSLPPDVVAAGCPVRVLRRLEEPDRQSQEQPSRLFLSPPHMSGLELEFVKQAFESNYIAPAGPQIEAFEQEFARRQQVEAAVAVSSGTAAMHLALRLLGVGEGDLVLAPTLTFMGGISPVLYLGAEPVFIDCAPGSFCLDPELVASELERQKRAGGRVKAVIAADLYGQSADYHALAETCRQHGVALVADSAESLGTWYRDRPSGWYADAAVFSFNGNKIITTSGGGMLASHDTKLVEQARFLSQQAKDPAPHYQHSTIGYNYRMSNVCAAIGRGQLMVLDQRVQRRRAIFETYHRELGGLPGIEFMPEVPDCRENRWLTVILIHPDEFGADREQVRLALERENIESRPVWKPMHLQPVFKGVRVAGGEQSQRLFELGLCLPSGSAMTPAQQQRVVEVVASCHRSA